MSTSDANAVLFTPFSEKHYMKKFRKAHKKAWDTTRISLEETFKQFDVILERNIAKVIAGGHGVKICKTEFRIAGTNHSRHGSGNRCIVALHTEKKRADVLLVYHKTHLPGPGSETSKWKNLVRKNYPEYADFL